MFNPSIMRHLSVKYSIRSSVQVQRRRERERQSVRVGESKRGKHKEIKTPSALLFTSRSLPLFLSVAARDVQRSIRKLEMNKTSKTNLITYYTHTYTHTLIHTHTHTHTYTYV